VSLENKFLKSFFSPTPFFDVLVLFFLWDFLIFFFLNLLIGRKKFYCKNKLLVITKIVCVVFFLQVNSLEREKKDLGGGKIFLQ